MLLNKSDFHLPYHQKLVAIAKELRKNATIPEKKLWQEYLHFLKHRFLRQRPIDNFIVDFYCASCRLIIEIDGDSHFTEEGQEYDLERTKILEGYGLTVVRFTNEQVMNRFEGVCAEIERLLIPPTPP
ncbi:endonuclease domain-containing protein [Anabaena sp. CS-542/02]|uniref:endonuclease domain-containing protein n=1 Tax=Anabaena sp. CS-542/02 TaxID=3021719 RepID=UPI00232E6370|nr:endonuclease domain-containing protein [Anabaena sp. CS-542/02]MDB9447512.1 endonuclease domain-containing protein [Anabaena sp. CS-542/02]